MIHPRFYVYHKFHLWEPADLFQFYYDTKAYYGNLDALVERIDQNAVYQAVHTGVTSANAAG